MSTDLLRARLNQDLDAAIAVQIEVLVQQHMPHEHMCRAQGVIAGLREAQNLLNERYKNLHAMG